jgi:lipid-A-disaccharide synthase-like uncharacterized protein
MSSLTLWLTVGFLGQALFTARFLIQWLVSEKKRASVVPTAFWWLSLLGGTALLAYAIFRRDPVIITGQALGLFVYTRNLMLVAKARSRRPQAGHKSRGNGLMPHYPRAATLKCVEPVLETRDLLGYSAE